ncbi:MAG TPA: hypothetical protein VFO94_02865, partial [Gammaproteobacteria bacterium]|nr:hypothetical protein [Gammaproteobacteria bacterium]
MNDQHRPGGLTALAILNFVFGGLALLSMLAPLLPLLAQLAPPDMNAEDRAQLDALSSLGPGWLTFAAVSGGIGGALLIASGIGYLQQKKFLGRVLGNVCAVVRLATTLTTVAWLPAGLGGGFG